MKFEAMNGRKACSQAGVRQWNCRGGRCVQLLVGTVSNAAATTAQPKTHSMRERASSWAGIAAELASKVSHKTENRG